MSGLDHSSTISQPALVESAVSAYRRMLVLWFCVASNAFTTYQGSTSATRLDHLIRLFLSACNDFHVALVDGQRKHADDVKAGSKAKAVEKAERDKARATATAKKTNKSTKSKPAKKTLSKKVTVTKKAPKSKKPRRHPPRRQPQPRQLC
jgi:sRNA-binding protein